MAVQAQYPSNVILPDFRNRARQIFGGDNRNFLSPLTFNQNTFLDDFQIHPPSAGGSNQLRMFNQLAGPSHGHQPALNAALFNEAENELACNLLGSRKRARESDDLLANQRQQHQILNVADFHQNHGSGSVVMPPSTGVSTGLRLAFEDERLNSTPSPSTSGRGDVSSALFSVMGDSVTTQLQQQREEIEQFFKIQGEQVRQLLEEKRQRHSRALIAAIEEGVSRRLREKDLEVEKVKRQNLELAEHVTKLRVEAHHWQSKAKTNEAIVTALRSNLQQAQQAAVLSREQSKEGCGDSEADDAASSHHDDMADAHARTFKENRELREQRTCRVCRCNDVSILLLPCRHLCLCKECETRLDACPLCRSLKNASVQVYMS